MNLSTSTGATTIDIYNSKVNGTLTVNDKCAICPATGKTAILDLNRTCTFGTLKINLDGELHVDGNETFDIDTLEVNRPIYFGADAIVSGSTGTLITSTDKYNSSSNTLNATITINDESILKLNPNADLGTHKWALTIDGHGTSDPLSSSSVSINGTIIAAENSSLTFSGANQTYNGTMTLNKAISMKGTIKISTGGQLTVDSGATFTLDDSSNLVINGSLSVESGATFTNSGKTSINGSLSLNDGATLTNSGGTFELPGTLKDDTRELNGTMKVTDGTLTWNGVYMDIGSSVFEVNGEKAHAIINTIKTSIYSDNGTEIKGLENDGTIKLDSSTNDLTLKFNRAFKNDSSWNFTNSTGSAQTYNINIAGDLARYGTPITNA